MTVTLRQDLPGWDWEYDTQAWEPDPRLQHFVDYWTNPGRPEISGSVINEVFDLGPYSNVIQKFTKQKLLIRACYDDIYTRVRLCRQTDREGVLLTGQPGVGKSLWLIYAVVRLLQDNSEPFVFARGQLIWVFYNKSVYYKRNAVDPNWNLPVHKDQYLISLIDTDSSIAPPVPLLVDLMSPVFPVQAASPNPSCYKEWKKQRGGITIGMPLWNVKELHAGFSVQKGFSTFAAAVTSYLHGSTNSTFPSFLDVLQKEALDSTVSGDGETHAWATSMLLDTSIREFGSAIYGSSARDVYRGAFNRTEEIESRSIACLRMNAEVMRRAHPSANLGPHDSSHQIVSLITVRSSQPHRSDTFEFGFKSDYIGAKIKEKSDLLTFKEAKDLAVLCRFVPGGSSFSGHLFETLAHYILAGQPNTKAAIGKIFVMEAQSSATYIWTPDIVADYDTFVMPRREITHVDFGLDKPYDHYDHIGTKYIIPSSPSNPLVDSFVVDFIPERSLTRVWLFQMTIAEVHRGSDKGYPRVRSIIAAAQERKQSYSLEVHYVLVVPDEARERRSWVMPAGWETAHPGATSVSVHCLVINLKGRNIICKASASFNACT